RPHERALTQPLDSPAAWRGADLRQRTDWQYPLADAEREELRTAVRWAQSTGKPMGQMSRDDFPLPTLARRLAEWRDEIRHGRGFVLIRGVPVKDWTEKDAEIGYWCLG